ncbi:ABC transporter substrate-binding protein [Nitratireductor sp. GCM10026969]|uniref:ABC transporter substrate-binding protein n=1 Tax=Nitratireductor sp. GCM10026969 TaxID=3252645 RepID=UPI00361628D3
MKRLIFIALLLLTALPARATETRLEAPGTAARDLMIESSTDFAIFEPMLRAFQSGHPDVAITYRELTTNELDDHVSAACEAGRFVADLVVSSSVDQQLKLVNDGCALALPAEARAGLPDWARWREELVGLTFEPAVMVYNRAYFTGRAVPQSRFELIDLLRESEDFIGKIGTYDIQASGVGYLFAFQDALQASTWGRLVESLGRNRARLFCCTAEILDRVADGRLLVGYNVLGSYALQMIRSDERIGIVLPSDYTLVFARAAFVPATARAPELAETFITFMLSPAGREVLTAQMRLLSPIDGAQELARMLADGSADARAFRPVAMTPALLVGLDRAKREIFLQEWRAALPSGDIAAGSP